MTFQHNKTQIGGYGNLRINHIQSKFHLFKKKVDKNRKIYNNNFIDIFIYNYNFNVD